MNTGDLSVIRKMLAHDLMQVYVRLFLLLTVVWFSVETFAPFLVLVLWSLILAVSLNPLNQWLSGRLSLGEGKAAVSPDACCAVNHWYPHGFTRRVAGGARGGVGADT